MRATTANTVAILFFMISDLAYGQETSNYCRSSPVINVVHGDDRGADIASEFLTGCDVVGAMSTGTAAEDCRESRLHAPQHLAGRHLHRSDEVELEVFFWDKNFISAAGVTGRDNDAEHGLESEAVLFFAGHSEDLSPRAYDGIPVPIERISLGDECARYLWMASCRVLAHGPKLQVPNFDLRDYIEPSKFDPGDGDHENVFKRWGSTYEETSSSPLNSRLRVACGGSSLIGGSVHPAELIWRRNLIERLPPAESFILGFVDPLQHAIPLCLSRGGQAPHQSPLFDSMFYVDPPTEFPKTHIWIEYPVLRPDLVQQVRNGSPWLMDGGNSTFLPPPSLMPVLAVRPSYKPWIMLDSISKKIAALSRSSLINVAGEVGVEEETIHQSDICVDHYEESGSLIVSWRPRELPTTNPVHLLPEELIGLLQSVARGNGEDGAAVRDAAMVLKHLTLVNAIDLQLDGAPADKATNGSLRASDILRERGCRFYFFEPSVTAASLEVPIVGIEGQWLWGACPLTRLNGLTLGDEDDPCLRQKTPALLTISFPSVLREHVIEETREVFSLEEAHKMIPLLFPPGLKRSDFEVVSYRWGYKEAPPHCESDRLYLVYEFDFRPLTDTSIGLGLLTLEVPAHKLCDISNPNACFAALEETWECSEEIMN